MSWFFSWLPQLPSLNLNFAIPSSIQTRFLSFILKKTLGHFFKPGQFDARQIDSQIGSGFVQVHDLELDSKAINGLISGLPLTLCTGTLSSATVRIPWPNPLTSTLGLSLKSLYLTFEIAPSASKDSPNLDLVSSVASVAEAFLHKELTPHEEASLLTSLHSELPSVPADVIQETVPGGLDPFDVGNEEEQRYELEPSGIPLFATLIERLLSRFECDAQDIQITVIHPDNVRLTFKLSEVKYITDVKETGNESQPETNGPTQSMTRTLAVNGIAFSVQDLRMTSGDDRTFSASFGQAREHAHSQVYLSSTGNLSSSSLDEETMISMSQSLASLPPRPDTLSQSVDASMYHSALSIVNEDNEDTQAQTVSTVISSEEDVAQRCALPEGEIIFSSGTSALTAQMTTVPSAPKGNDGPGRDKMLVTIQVGLLGCALKAWHITSLSTLCMTLLSRLPSSSNDTRRPSTLPEDDMGFAAFDIEATLNIRGVVLLLLPPESAATPSNDLQGFFARPLIPPSLHSGYMRLHVEGFSASLSLCSNAEIGNGAYPKSDKKTMKGSFSIHNIFAFVFPAPSSAGPEVPAFPILLIDEFLPMQYSSPHPSSSDGTSDHALPEFEILDWTRSEHQIIGGARISYWRSKPPHTRSSYTDKFQHLGESPESRDSSLDDASRAFSFTFEKQACDDKRNSRLFINGTIAPLHLFIDFGDLFGYDTAIKFLDEISSGLTLGEKTVEAENTPSATPQTCTFNERDNQCPERLRNPDTEHEHGYQGTYSRHVNKKSRNKADQNLEFFVRVSAIRVELRVPPPHGDPRSGAFICDIHEMSLANVAEKHRNHARFLPLDQPEVTMTENQPILTVKCQRVLFAYSCVQRPIARAFVSIGSLSTQDMKPSFNIGGGGEPLRPRISVIQSQPKSGVITALVVEIPSVYVVMSKETLDGLQYFIDDTTQLLESYTRRVGNIMDKGSTETSLIGSRFFTKSRDGSRSESALLNSNNSHDGETVVKITVSEAFVRALLPRNETTVAQPMDVIASEIGLLIELRPEGKEETVITLEILDAKIKIHKERHQVDCILELTSPRSLMSTPRPLVKLRFASFPAPGSMARETRLNLSLCDITVDIHPDITWVEDLLQFVKSPPGTFESAIPNERTRIAIKLLDTSIRFYAPTNPGSLVVYAAELALATEIAGSSVESNFNLNIGTLSLLAIDDVKTSHSKETVHDVKGHTFWKTLGFALLTEIANGSVIIIMSKEPVAHANVMIDGLRCSLHLCADSISAFSALISDILQSVEEPSSQPEKEPIILAQMSASRNLMASVEDIAFKRPPEIGPPPDMIDDDLPTNADYLDESFGAAAGLREFSDDELDDFDPEHEDQVTKFEEVIPGTTSDINGETIKVYPEGINMIENYYDNLPADTSNSSVGFSDSKLKIRIRNSDATLFLYDGYDWVRTRKTIEDEVKEMRRRLAKIRQLVATGQAHDSDMEDTSAVLFNSVYIGLKQDIDEMEPGALLAAIDEELKEDVETSTQSSWQSLRPPTTVGGKSRPRPLRVQGKKLTRSKGPNMEFKFMGLTIDVDQFHPDEMLVSRTFVTVRDVEILDHIKTSTWKKFLTASRSDSKGNIRETDSDMVRVELRGVRPAPGHSSEEIRLKAKILPLRLYVDQDAVDFLKKFFSFKDPHEIERSVPEKTSPEAYIQLAEIFPIDLKLDYKPRRVDYRALREGRTIELMNFFHFDGAEMTLRHITLAGVTGWPRLFELLNDLWTPDVKATQLVDVISGVSPIRSVVNVGSGVADLVLLPISQYKKDGRVVRGMQKGATAFVRSTAMEAIKMGARLATGTQVILEHAENVLGSPFNDTSLQVSTLDETGGFNVSSIDEEDDELDLISKYAEQPTNIKEGLQSAYHSLRRNLNSAAQTILAVPMEVYERSGNEGPVHSVIRAVPIAVLKPMIGASEAISKTLLGLQNSLDPNVQNENEAKYKRH